MRRLVTSAQRVSLSAVTYLAVLYSPHSKTAPFWDRENEEQGYVKEHLTRLQMQDFIRVRRAPILQSVITLLAR